MTRRTLKWCGAIGLVAMLALMPVLAACAGDTDEENGENTETAITAENCTTCHDDTTLVLSKSQAGAGTTHQAGTAWSYAGGRAGCTACHSSEGFQASVAAGLNPDEYAELDTAPTNPSPPNCRTCHEIHTTYTTADFALKTTAPVTLIASGKTFDRGDGNLCTSCHQPRRTGPEEGAGDYEITSTHWGPHHGPQSTVLLGIDGYGVADSTSIHYTLVEEGCPTCHMADDDHTLAASTAGCQSCHTDLDTLDRNGVQTEIKALFDELAELLEAAGPIHDGHPNPGTYSEELAGAAWNYMIVYEDNSWGVHNPSWTKAILEKSIELAK